MKLKYDYSLADESLMTPYIYKYFVDPLLKVIPYRLPANIITFISNSFVTVAFIIVTLGYLKGNYFLYWLVPFLIFAYLVGDALDGRQARRTKTGSQLGEFFDHFLDTFVSGLIIGMVLLAYRIDSPFVIFMALYSGYISQAAAFYERYFTGIMYFAKIGSNEGVLVMSILILLSPILFPLTTILPIFGLPLFYYILVVLFSVIPLKSAIMSVLRSQNLTKEFTAYAIINIFVVSSCSVLYDIPLAVVVITLFNVDYIEGLLISTGFKIQDKDPDFLAVTVLFVAAVIGFTSYILLGIIIAYLAIKVLYKFSSFFKEFKHCWYWINPPKVTNETI